MADWQTVSSEDIYETDWIKVRRDKVLNHAGKELTYSYIKQQRPSVFIIAINAKGQVYLQRNYRYTIGKSLVEVPAGFTDGQEGPLEAAKRELLEEAGLTSDDWTNLGQAQQAGGLGDFPLVVFLAKNVRPAPHQRDGDEEISQGHFVNINDIEDMIAKGEMLKSAHIAAFYLAKLRIQKDKEN